MKPSPLLSAALLVAAALPAAAQRVDYEDEPHNYFSVELYDACTKFDLALRDGKATIEQKDEKQMVRDVLKHLNVNLASQVMVFSKSSLQKDLMGPRSPRCVWFNDETYVGWVSGGLMEFGSVGPRLGPVFYSLNPNRPDRAVPRLDRSESCMNCHGGSMTNNVPGFMLRSVFPDKDGQMLLRAGTSLIDHTTPIKERWGGWYVTGNHGTMKHMGNSFAAPGADGNVILNTEGSFNLKSLGKFFDTKPYLRADSDIVALMVMEHQVAMQSRLTEAAYDLRSAIVRQKGLREELEEPPTDEFFGSTKVVADSHMEKVLKCLLFVGEALMPDGGVDGGMEFQEAFRANKQAAPDGKSLKDLQLLTHIFKHRCSYQIYTAQWDALPVKFLEQTYRRLYDILTAAETVKGYGHLSAGERKEILEILRATKPGLPAYWKS